MADDRDARIAQLEAENAALGVELDAARQRETVLAADLTDSREQQVATAAVLRVIAAPTSDLSVILETVMQSAVWLSSSYTESST